MLRWLMLAATLNARAYTDPACQQATERLNAAMSELGSLADDYFECVDTHILGPLDPTCRAIKQDFDQLDSQIPNLQREKNAACRPKIV